MKVVLPVASPVSLQPKGTPMKMRTTRRNEENEVSIFLFFFTLFTYLYLHHFCSLQETVAWRAP